LVLIKKKAMSQGASEKFVCQICKKSKGLNQRTIAEFIRPSLLEFITKKVPAFDAKGLICLDDLGRPEENMFGTCWRTNSADSPPSTRK
jgi:hypothetical protein